MRTITEYLQKGHISQTPSLFIKDMSYYKAINYKDFTKYGEYHRSINILLDVVNIVKKLYHVSKLTKEMIIEFFDVHYTEFINMQFNDKRITEKIEKQLKTSKYFSSASGVINYFKENLNKHEGNNEDNFAYWCSPCYFNGFIKLVNEINNENT